MGIFVHYSGLISIFFNYPAGTKREREREKEREREREREREMVTLYSICFLGVMCLSFTS